MAIRGEKFLYVSQANAIGITDHALDRLREYTGLDATRSLASVLFAHSRQVSVQEMGLLGYRPGYARRKDRGVNSWYFRFMVFGLELVAVVSGGTGGDPLAWVTTYCPNAQSEYFRLADLESLAAA